MSKFRELGGWFITRSAIDDYKERVTDDPTLERGCTALDIKRRIRSAVNEIKDFDELLSLGGIVVYRTKFIRRGQDYYILINPNQKPRVVVGIWTENIYQNYLEGKTSKGHTIYGRRRQINEKGD